MPSSIARISANRANAQKSTGAITQLGKQTVSQNALKHGLFAKKLVLDDEDTAEFNALLEELRESLYSVGVLEHSLVERIATSLWRQKRLVKAGSAHLNLERQAKKIATIVEHEINPNFHSGRAVTERDLIAPDTAQLMRYQAIVDEYEGFNADTFDVTAMETALPTLYQQLASDAKEKAASPEQFIQNYSSPADYFSMVADYCHDQLRQSSA